MCHCLLLIIIIRPNDAWTYFPAFDDHRISYINKTTALLGEEFVMACKSPKHSRWYFSKLDRLPITEPISYKNILTLSPVRMNHSGYYFCYGAYSYYGFKHFIAKSEIDVYGETKLTNFIYIFYLTLF